MYDEGVDIAVVNYKTRDDLIRFVESFYNVNDSAPKTLHVVDVDTTPGEYEKTKEQLVSVGAKQIYYWPFFHNCYYSGACNFVSSYSEKRVLAFFNADTKLETGVIDSCYNLTLEDEVAVVGPKQVNSQNKITHAGIFGINTAPKHRGWMEYDKGQYDDIRHDAVTVSGSAYFVDKKVWDELFLHEMWQTLFPGIDGCFLPTEHYYEETWYSYWVRHNGYKVVYDGSSKMVHEWHKASPVGSVERTKLDDSRTLFRQTCSMFRIDCD